MHPQRKVTSSGATILKCVVLGDSCVGKTSLTKRIAHNRFDHMYQSTIGADFEPLYRCVDDEKVCLQLWDESGGGRYRPRIELTRSRGVDIYFLCYDVADHESFDNVVSLARDGRHARELGEGSDWFSHVVKYTWDVPSIIAILGLKIDLDFKRQVEKEEGEQMRDSVAGYSWVHSGAPSGPPPGHLSRGQCENSARSRGSRS